MKKQSRKSARRDLARKKSEVVTSSVDSLNNVRQVALDFFRNAAARMGHGTPSLPQDTTYVMDRISLNYWLLLTLYRNHWLSRRIVDLPAQDMCKSWSKLQGQMDPDDIQRFDRVVEKTLTPSRIEQAIIWGRLFGGAGCLICIKGHEKILEKPLDFDDIDPGSYLGLIPFDRWVGIVPMTGDISTDLSNPLDWGLPKYYEVRDASSAQSFKVHCSRILRFIGPSVPTPELQAQTYWGISVLEPAYEDITKLDNATWSTLNMMFRAQLIGQRNPELAQLLSGLGMPGQAMQRWQAAMQAQNELMSNQSMMILGKEGELFTTQYSFAGMSDVVSMFIMLSSGAAEIPVTKLFGRTITGLSQSNEGDERLYEASIAHKQASELKPQLASKLYPVICMSVLGEIPDDLDLMFPSVRVMQEEEKAELADKGCGVILAAHNAGVTSPKTTLQELRELSDRTGIFTNITDEQIEAASDEPQMGGEEMIGLGGPGEPKPGAEENPNPDKDWRKYLPKSPSSELHKESGVSRDMATGSKRISAMEAGYTEVVY